MQYIYLFRDMVSLCRADWSQTPDPRHPSAGLTIVSIAILLYGQSCLLLVVIGYWRVGMGVGCEICTVSHLIPFSDYFYSTISS